jgi:hypothetical protein
MQLTDQERNVYVVIMNMDKTIKELMLQRDVLAAMLPSTSKAKRCKISTLKELRTAKK